MNKQISLAFFISILLFGVHCSIFEDEDSFIIEESPTEFSSDIETTTILNSDEEISTAQPENSCITSAGVNGICMKIQDCYPYMFIGKDGSKKLDVTTGLQEFVENSLHTDSCDESNETICCSSNYLPIGKFPSYIRQGESEISSTNFEDSQIIGDTNDTENNATTRIATCGLSRVAFDGKIVGGRPALKGEFPYIVAILKNGRQKCGGSLINNRYIITAAHCLQVRSSSRLKQFSIYIGDHNIGTRNEVPYEITRGVDRLVIHKGFNQRQLRDDIALMRLDKPIEFNANVQPVCLDTTRSSLIGWSADVSGWGQISEHGPQSQILKTTNLKIMSNKKCQSKYVGTPAPPIHTNMVCAGGLNLPGDSCLGDSGGPLTVQENGRAKLVGIVSWGIGCGSKYPGVYTRVSPYLSWIRKHMI